MKKYLLLFLLGICGIANAQFTKLLDFSGATNGSRPYGSLFYDGTFLYGMTNLGGTNNLGVIFKIKSDGTGYSKLLDFAGTTNGNLPDGDFISDGTFLYGTTSQGGTNGYGTIFKIKPDGTGYIKLLDFTGSANGSIPRGTLISDGTFLYGMTWQGGTSGDGVVFKIKFDGTGFVKLLDFIGTNGSTPSGSLIYDGTFLYGMTEYGGTSGDGVIFKILPNGTGFVNLLDFAGTTNGSLPQGSLIYDGIFLYGMTNSGGANNFGTVFKIKPDGTAYSDLLDFAGAANGKNPFASLISDGTFLYGMTPFGGTNNDGVIFKIKPDGSAYSSIHNLSGSTDGRIPVGSLVSDGTFLYGMTSQGGANNLGTVFKLALATGFFENKLAYSFALFPNPSTGILNISGTLSDLKKISVKNVLGQEIYSSSETNFAASGNLYSIDLSSLTKGIYFVELDGVNSQLVKKIVLSK